MSIKELRERLGLEPEQYSDAQVERFLKAGDLELVERADILTWRRVSDGFHVGVVNRWPDNEHDGELEARYRLNRYDELPDWCKETPEQPGGIWVWDRWHGNGPRIVAIDYEKRTVRLEDGRVMHL